MDWLILEKILNAVKFIISGNIDSGIVILLAVTMNIKQKMLFDIIQSELKGFHYFKMLRVDCIQLKKKLV